mgnify:CR=1 FL=1
MADQHMRPSQHAAPTPELVEESPARVTAREVQEQVVALQAQLDALEDLVTGKKVPGGLVALTVPIKVEEALHAVILELQQSRTFRNMVTSALSRVQPNFKRGPLTELLKVLAGE